MNLNIPLLKPVRILLLPFSLVYALIIGLRNFCYDRKLLQSTSFNLPIICVGNLAVGGTGKSPMVEFLIKKLRTRFAIAVLSRGYKRKTRGYALANEKSTALDIGDEPMQFHSKFPEIAIAVGEERIVAIPQLLHDRPQTRAIILDDAFQHRAVHAGFNILLTDYSNLFTRDWYLPTGDLRDEKRSYKRSDLIVVTKCQDDLSIEEARRIRAEIKPLANQHLFFSSIRYGVPYHITGRQQSAVDADTEVLLVTGIANPLTLKNWLDEFSKTYYELSYSDHHVFSIDDLRYIVKKFNEIQAGKKIILTTEKDAVRLVKFDRELKDLPIYVIPIEPQFLFNGEEKFTDLIVTFISNFHYQS